MHRYIWLIPLLPLAGAAINGLLRPEVSFFREADWRHRRRFDRAFLSAHSRGSLFLRFQQPRHVAQALRHQPGWRFQFHLDSGRRSAADAGF